MDIDIFLIRHAAALPLEPGRPDAVRALSREGREGFGRCVEGLRVLGIRFDRVLHSPLVRAVETAELLLPLCEGGLQLTPSLAEAPGEALFREAAARQGESIALVGHEPWMSVLTSILLTGDGRHSAGLAFKKGGVAWLRGPFEAGRMRLVALLPPRVLRRQ
jgi:phosphohistidine phosphatase